MKQRADHGKNGFPAAIGGLLDRAAARFPRAEALVDIPSGRRITYAELQEKADILAGGLLALGLAPGDHLALWAPNQPEWVICQAAAAKAGLVLINVDASHGPRELAYLLKAADCRALITAPGLEGGEYLEAVIDVCPEVADPAPDGLACRELPELRRVIVLADQAPAGAGTLAQVAALGAKAPRPPAPGPEDAACLFFTSGTTGDPKGVLLTHRGLVSTSRASAANQELTPADRLCVSVPLSHVFGCACVALAALAAGCAMVIPARRPDPASALAAVERERCTAVYGAPTLFIDMLQLQKESPRDIGSLRTGIMAGAVCPLEVMNKVVHQMGLAGILVGYGQTESSSWISLTAADDPLELRVSTVGRPIDGVEVRIMDPDTGDEAPPGQVGELCARGFNMKGYYRMPAATAQALDPEGWLHTGDLAAMDRRGYIRIAGRLKEVIRRAGRVIYPSEVEDALFSHPSVANAQVFGLPDEELGQEAAAWVKLEPDADRELAPDALLAWCADRLGPDKTPAFLKFVDAFPMTNLGKIQKHKMSSLYARELGRTV